MKFYNNNGKKKKENVSFGQKQFNKKNKKLVEKCYNFWKFVHLLIFDVFGR